MIPSVTAPKRLSCSARCAILYACVLICGIISSRYGVIGLHHEWRMWVELDVGALHIGWVPSSPSGAFAPSSLEFLPTTGWNWSGWLPRIECPSPGKGYVAMPLWLLFFPLLVPTLIQRFRPSPRPATTCRTCDYNLYGNTSGNCPECGTPVRSL